MKPRINIQKLSGLVTKPRLINNIVLFPSIGNGFFGRSPMFSTISSASIIYDRQANRGALRHNCKQEKEKFRLTLTCKKCDATISKVISATAYYKGVVILNCEACKNKYLIADNLNCISEDNNRKNIKEIMTEQGNAVQKIMSVKLELHKNEDMCSNNGMLLKSAVVTCINT